MMLSKISPILGAIGGALVAGSAAYFIGNYLGERTGYQKAVAETAIAFAEAELKRKNDDAKLQTLSDYDLCILGLSGSGMPIDACAELRGVQEE